MIVCAVVLLVTAVADVATHHTDTGFLLSWLRNANYRMLEAGEIGGFKRIVGTFTEAGAFSYVALGFHAFCLSLWLDGLPHSHHRNARTASRAIAVAVDLDDGLWILGDVLLSHADRCACEARQRAGHRQGLRLSLVFSMIPFLLGTAILFAPSIWSAMTGLYDAAVSNKLESQSGIERMRWNHFAMKNFWDTAGFGAGRRERPGIELRGRTARQYWRARPAPVRRDARVVIHDGKAALV